MGNKLVRGSLIIFIGNIIFRIGGYLYRFLMATLLGPVNNGILGTTISVQGIFQTLSSGGLPPAISKYIAEYEAVDDHNMARQTIYTALKIMVFLGLLLGVLMIFVIKRAPRSVRFCRKICCYCPPGGGPNLLLTVLPMPVPSSCQSGACSLRRWDSHRGFCKTYRGSCYHDTACVWSCRA